MPKPGSPARPIHLKLISLGGLFSEVLASSVTPTIAGMLGWRAVNVIMGGGGLLCAACWLLFAKSKPAHFRRRGDRSGTLITLEQIEHKECSRRDNRVASDSTGSSASLKTGKAASPLALFKHPAVIATLWCKMASGNMNYTTTQWTPTYFVEALGAHALDYICYRMHQRF